MVLWLCALANCCIALRRMLRLDSFLLRVTFTCEYELEPNENLKTCPDIITNPTIGSGPLAPSLAGFVSREDYDALNKEAENSTLSKRVEGSLEFVQHLLKADKITQL